MNPVAFAPITPITPIALIAPPMSLPSPDVAPHLTPVLAYRPLMEPLPYVWAYWPWLLLPLCIAVAVVYKSIKCRSMKQVPREAAVITVWILAGLGAAAVSLWAIVALLIGHGNDFCFGGGTRRLSRKAQPAGAGSTKYEARNKLEARMSEAERNKAEKAEGELVRTPPCV